VTGPLTNSSGATLDLVANSGDVANVNALSNSGTVSINGGTVLNVTGTGSKFTQTAGTTTDDGSLTLPSSGSLSLNGGNLYGKGTITGAVTSSGTITPGDSSAATGILTDKGTYTQNSTGTLDISIGGTTAGTQYDQLNPTTASLKGTLNISLTNGFVPAVGNTFKIMNFNSKSGTFATVNGLKINSSEHFTLTYQGTDVLLTVVSGAAAPTFGQLNSLRAVGPSYSAAEPGRFGLGRYGGGRSLPTLSLRVSTMAAFGSPLVS